MPPNVRTTMYVHILISITLYNSIRTTVTRSIYQMYDDSIKGKSINDWIVEGSLIVSQQQQLQSTQFINTVPTHPALLSDWCYYNNTSVIHCAPGSALIKPSLWHQIQMIFYSVINLRWLSPFVGVCYEHVSWDVPYSPLVSCFVLSSRGSSS